MSEPSDLNDDILSYDNEYLLDDELLDDKIDDEDELLLSDEELEAESAVQSSVPSVSRVLAEPAGIAVESSTPDEAEVRPTESTPELRPPEDNGTVSSTPEKVSDSVVSTRALENDLVDSTCTISDSPQPASALATTNEVSSTDGSIPDYNVDLKCSSSTPGDNLSTPDSKILGAFDSCKTENSDVVSSVDGTPKSFEAEPVDEDERQERINPKLAVEKQQDEGFEDSRKRPLGPGEVPGVVPMPSRSGAQVFYVYPPGPKPRPGFSGRMPFYQQFRPGMRPNGPGRGVPGITPMYRPPMRPGFMPPSPLLPTPSMPFHPGPPQQLLPPSGPRKVLINPNFKGGVEAVTSQLMREHQMIARPLSDEELLRQQQEFITRNLIQVEKRRHESSPPPRKRTRSRSVSPSDRRRRSRSRSPYRAGRYNRDRRPPWRGGGRNQDNWGGRRRRSFDRDNRREEHEDEDEETRAYREQIEKQKAMREKILRDKEKRRKEAIEAEKKQKELEEQKKRDEEASLKCTPIVVTGKKIISLKSVKAGITSDEESVAVAKLPGKLPSKPETGEDTKTTAVVKPLPKLSRPVIDDIDEKLERELLEESTTPPLATPNPNRRVVIKDDPSEATLKRKTQSQQVFERLDKKALEIETLMFRLREDSKD